MTAAMRQDPDVILVGEIRDRETAATALKAAETGHLVLSAIHTPDAVATIQRYVGLFETDAQDVVRDRLGDCLQAVVSLRLLASKDGRRRLPAVEILRVTRTIRECIRVGAPQRHPGAHPQGPRPLLDAAVRSAPDRSRERGPRLDGDRDLRELATPKSSSARCASNNAASTTSRNGERRRRWRRSFTLQRCRSVATDAVGRCSATLRRRGGGGVGVRRRVATSAPAGRRCGSAASACGPPTAACVGRLPDADRRWRAGAAVAGRMRPAAGAAAAAAVRRLPADAARARTGRRRLTGGAGRLVPPGGVRRRRGCPACHRRTVVRAAAGGGAGCGALGGPLTRRRRRCDRL